MVKNPTNLDTWDKFFKNNNLIIQQFMWRAVEKQFYELPESAGFQTIIILVPYDMLWMPLVWPFIFYLNSAQHTVQWTKNNVNCLLYLSRDILQHHQLSTEIMRHDINWDRCTSQRSLLYPVTYLSIHDIKFLINKCFCIWKISLLFPWTEFTRCFIFSTTRSIYLKIVTENVFTLLSY